MLTIEIEFLTGRYCAGRFNDASAPEWPPHPQRLFSAMVATWADADEPDAREHEALEWLEALGAPELTCSPAFARAPVVSYVPVNDSSVAAGNLARRYAEQSAAIEGLASAKKGGDERAVARAQTKLAKVDEKLRVASAAATAPKNGESPGTAAAGLGVLPENRVRQPRTYPTVLPHSPLVQFCWREADGHSNHVSVLDNLLARVHRLGHSSSFVSCRVSGSPSATTLVPSSDGAEWLRVTEPGLLRELEAAFLQHGGREARTLPTAHASYSLSEKDKVQPTSVLGGDWIVLAPVDMPRLVVPMTRSVELTSAVRAALLSHAADPVPELISGHHGGYSPRTGSPPSQQPHLAVLPLVFAGAPHADAYVRGVALAVPEDAGSDDRRALFEALENWGRTTSRVGQLPVRMGSQGLVRLRIVAGPVDRAVLRRNTWCRPDTDWATVLPVALDRHPGNIRDRSQWRREKSMAEAASSIAVACTYIGLPLPARVEVDRDGFLSGVKSVTAFPPFASGAGPVRALVHARVHFAEKVRGPVVIGAGRYRGLGLMKPLTQERSLLS